MIRMDIFGVVIDLQINTEVVRCQPPCLLSMKNHFHIVFFIFPDQRCFSKVLLKTSPFDF